MTPTPGFFSVIVRGRGPAGLLLSILLAHHNPALYFASLRSSCGTQRDSTSSPLWASASVTRSTFVEKFVR